MRHHFCEFTLKLASSGAPVLYEGTVDDHFWEFSARHSDWWLGIKKTADGDIVWADNGTHDNASWMGPQEAIGLIVSSALKWLVESQGGPKTADPGAGDV